jgi:hypothetical protein
MSLGIGRFQFPLGREEQASVSSSKVQQAVLRRAARVSDR